MRKHDANRAVVESDLETAKDRVLACETNGATLEEYRVRVREMEHIQHLLDWFDLGRGIFPN